MLELGQLKKWHTWSKTQSGWSVLPVTMDPLSLIRMWRCLKFYNLFLFRLEVTILHRGTLNKWQGGHVTTIDKYFLWTLLPSLYHMDKNYEEEKSRVVEQTSVYASALLHLRLALQSAESTVRDMAPVYARYKKLWCHNLVELSTWWSLVYNTQYTIRGISYKCFLCTSSQHPEWQKESTVQITIRTFLLMIINCCRTILGFWAGHRNSKVRVNLAQAWEKDPVLFITNNRISRAIGEFVYQKQFFRSKFCICPAGSQVNSARIAESIHYGCVPGKLLHWRLGSSKDSVIIGQSTSRTQSKSI